MTGPSEDHYCSGHCIKGKCMACTAAERDLLRDALTSIAFTALPDVQNLQEIARAALNPGEKS